MTTQSALTFTVRTVRVPETRVVRLPGSYAHEFASIPTYWREIRDVRSRFVDYPVLDPASERALIGVTTRGDR